MTHFFGSSLRGYWGYSELPNTFLFPTERSATDFLLKHRADSFTSQLYAQAVNGIGPHITAFDKWSGVLRSLLTAKNVRYGGAGY